MKQDASSAAGKWAYRVQLLQQYGMRPIEIIVADRNRSVERRQSVNEEEAVRQSRDRKSRATICARAIQVCAFRNCRHA